MWREVRVGLDAQAHRQNLPQINALPPLYCRTLCVDSAGIAPIWRVFSIAVMNNEPPSILLVEDDTTVLAALKGILEREQFHIVACTNPLKALDVLADREFAVIMSDQRMPEMAGVGFLV